MWSLLGPIVRLLVAPVVRIIVTVPRWPRPGGPHTFVVVFYKSYRILHFESLFLIECEEEIFDNASVDFLDGLLFVVFLNRAEFGSSGHDQREKRTLDGRPRLG